MRFRAPLAVLLLPALVVVASGCGREERQAATPQARQEAAADLDGARREVEARRARLEEAKQAREAAEAQREAADAAVAKAADAYEKAQDELRGAEETLASLMPPPPSDEEVFRRVQKQLLDAPGLARVAIRAEVDERKVTLHGTVPDEATRDAAVSIARAVDGVADVESEIRVGAP